MKRYNNLFKEVCSYENIQLAHKNAQVGKKHYREVKAINKDPQTYLKALRKSLVEKTFKNSEYEVFTRVMDNGKEREIMKLPYYPDRIVHHCIMQIMEPIWQKSLIRDTYAAIKLRGIHDGVLRIKESLRDIQGTKYCLKLDIQKYYPSINNGILKQIIRRKIKDNDILWLLDEIIDSAKGVPIGNYLSQYFGNLYLSQFDHWMKEKIRCKYYYRYCDDIVILSSDKNELHIIEKQIDEYLLNKLKLVVKKNWQIFPVDVRGIDFLGYRFFHNYTLVRKSIAKRMISKIANIRKAYGCMKCSQIINVVMSYVGWLKYANAKNLINSLFDKELYWIVKHTSIRNGIKNPLQGKYI